MLLGENESSLSVNQDLAVGGYGPGQSVCPSENGSSLFKNGISLMGMGVVCVYV